MQSSTFHVVLDVLDVVSRMLAHSSLEARGDVRVGGLGADCRTGTALYSVFTHNDHVGLKE